MKPESPKIAPKWEIVWTRGQKCPIGGLRKDMDLRKAILFGGRWGGGVVVGKVTSFPLTITHQGTKVNEEGEVSFHP